MVTERKNIFKRTRKRGKPVQVLGLKISVDIVLSIEQDVKYLCALYGPLSVSRSLGISRTALHYYKTGKRKPKLLISVAIQNWAKEERDNENKKSGQVR
ncbi:hypothetical protein DEALK_09780 [Dehalogenimonas alkenigignens]|uniref:Uncharacterized protein n=1 Tax=Dehalogenimonas alkenigignens TaxID=1217799 RepID=A0A0W0GHX7_9CHLR|nr:hypothetical protein DEALK_09780 [Dehalogenimonas alkenigignens]